MPVPYGVALWPGVVSLESARYTVSHGISPGVAQLVIHPQADPFAEFGDLIFTDGVNGIITVPNCKIDRVDADIGDGGRHITLSILDRRWQWRDLGAISGTYNQKDRWGKYLPWTVRTPSQLCALCLEAMGEKNYVIQVPDLTLPPIDWQAMPPAHALAALADQLACRVVYRLDTDSVWVVPVGAGLILPLEGSVFNYSPSLDSPERPDSIRLYGAPLRFQWRFQTEAVGIDWDGHYRPINELSYAPAIQGSKPQRFKVTPAGLDTGNSLLITFSFAENAEELGVAEYETTGSSVATACAGLTDAINQAGLPFAAVNKTTYVEITPDDTVGYTLDCVALPGSSPSSTPTLTWELLAAPNPGNNRWAYCGPSRFAGVQATDRLLRRDAIALAQKSVFKCYRIKTPINHPGYLGEIKRIQQILLQSSRVEQIEPTPLDERLVDGDGERRIVHFYNGYSRDKPPAAYGSHFLWTGERTNTDKTKEIPISFSIDAEFGVITFSEYVLFNRGGMCEPAQVILETGCNVRHADTNAIELYGADFVFPGIQRGTPPAIIHQEDCQLNVIGVYQPGTDIPVGIITDQEFSEVRARYYLAGAALKYQVTGAQTVGYNGLLPLLLDGAIQQVTWEVGSGGCTTIASRNCEHAVYVPPFPVRRRAEYLAPAGVAARQAQGDRFAPPLYGSPREARNTFTAVEGS